MKKLTKNHENERISGKKSKIFVNFQIFFNFSQNLV